MANTNNIENDDIEDITDDDDVKELPLPSKMMPKKQQIVQMQPESQQQAIPKKRTRTMSKEALDQLQRARLKAIEVKKNSKSVNAELGKIRKETFDQKVDEIKTYKIIKQKVEDEVKANEIVSINNKLNDMYTKFNGFLEDRDKRKNEKMIKKQEKSARQIAQELPMAINKQLLDEELKKLEIERMRRRCFGI